MRRVLCAAVTFVLVLPARLLHRRAVLMRWAQEALAGVKAKAAVLFAGILVAVVGAETVHPYLMVAGIAWLTWFGFGFATSILERPLGLRRLDGRRFPLADVPPAAETLRRLGLDQSTVDRLVEAGGPGRETLLASFDQENRLLSTVGPIPYFAESLVDEAGFIRRIRHLVDLVVVDGVVAVRKSYDNPTSLQNEAIALAALAGVSGVPRIVRLDRRRRVMHQSFLTGENLGTLLAEHGASVDIQHEAVTRRPDRGTWGPATPLPEARQRAVAALQAAVPAGTVDALAALVARIHHAGVTLGDVKYGNVLLHDGAPVLCDFDWARVHEGDAIESVERRDDERDLFNYLFDSHLPTLGILRAELASLRAGRPDLMEAMVDIGRGCRFGRRWTLEGGTGRWLSLRGTLVGCRGRRVVDLGTRDPILLLEVLRHGASSVVTYQRDPDRARLARTCHRLAEIMDDREYALEIVDGVPPSTALRPSGEVVFLAEPDDAVARELLERTGRTPRRVAGWCGTAPILIVGPV
ncbi:MAG: hypothetical protein K1X31_12185 [Gemmatimonadaceae bacterium]|nr:hypothetical protein [Gemmatimonadaceae bacterium]